MNIEHGFFVQKHVNDIAAMKDVRLAASYVGKVIDSYVEHHPGVHPENVRRARAIVAKALTPLQLAMAIQNFILAHPSEGLKVI